MIHKPNHKSVLQTWHVAQLYMCYDVCLFWQLTVSLNWGSGWCKPHSSVFQDRSRMFDSLNMHSLESSLIDIMRAEQDPMKGKILSPSPFTFRGYGEASVFGLSGPRLTGRNPDVVRWLSAGKWQAHLPPVLCCFLHTPAYFLPAESLILLPPAAHLHDLPALILLLLNLYSTQSRAKRARPRSCAVNMLRDYFFSTTSISITPC